MKTWMLMGLICLSMAASGQLAEPLFFSEKVHDFGEISEFDGPVSYEFSFTNNGPRPAKILTVRASCGCTTPGWSQEPIPPGKTGFIKVSYDPKGRPGYFDKALTITTDLDLNTLFLKIKGNVITPKPNKKIADLPEENGSLRLKSSSFNLGKIFINKEAATLSFPMYNSALVPIQFLSVEAPSYIKVETPNLLWPAERSYIKITYDAKARNQYGFVSENILIKTSDDEKSDKSFSVYATIEEFFSPLNPDELKKAPFFQLLSTSADMGKIITGKSQSKSFSFRNTGKNDLEIRFIQPNCSCVTTALSFTKLKAGEEGKLNITFNSTGRKGYQQKAVTIYTNDPRNPVQRITITANVVD